MANVFRRAFRYLSASANRKLDEKADPRVQIDQAIEESRRSHEALRQQAARVLGNQRQIEMRLARQIEQVTMLTDSARSALTFADGARAKGDAPGAAQYEQTAQAFAGELVAAEASLDEMRELHQQAAESSALARQAVDDNTERLRGQLAERARLLTQIEHAAMREQMSKAMESMSELTPQADTPTLAEIREKVERRYANAMGRHELASSGVEARMLEVRRAAIDARASSRLAELRASLGPAPSATPPPGAVDGGSERVALGKAVPPPPAAPASDDWESHGTTGGSGAPAAS
jgi:phage shock protein A